jgi:hypothetical protein
VHKKIGLAVLLAALSGIASAAETCKINTSFGISVRECTTTGAFDARPAKAPEIDSGSAITGFALTLGGLAVLCSRRMKARNS